MFLLNLTLKFLSTVTIVWSSNLRHKFRCRPHRIQAVPLGVQKLEIWGQDIDLEKEGNRRNEQILSVEVEGVRIREMILDQEQEN